MTNATTPFDAAVYLDTPEAIRAYLTDAAGDPDPEALIDAIGTVAAAIEAAQAREDRLRDALRRIGLPGRTIHHNRHGHEEAVLIARAALEDRT